MRDELELAESAQVAQAIREALARQRISRQTLADRARISLSTLEKSLSGQRAFSLATLVRLEAALGMALRPAPAASASRNVGIASDALGAYARATVDWLEGEYLTLRPSYSKPGAVYAYRTKIDWDEARTCLVFAETDRTDAGYAQNGVVSVSNISGHAYLVTNSEGQQRLVILSRPTITGELFGVIATLMAGKGAQLTPVASPIALLPLRQAAGGAVGLIEAGHADHARYRRVLTRVTEDGFAVLLSPMPE
ncbi:MAG: helix-turn-helix domain-containing protein [Nevskiaceae bacterium]|nr:helix-turn-helix domain-containing protein [Nevskiaceae bacterium]